ncbi:MAG: hypothetical protein AAGC96_15335 [Pseudomonadota bacterium]
MMKFAAVFLLAVLQIAMAVPDLRAENIPSHITAMGAQLYRGIQDDLKSKTLDREQSLLLEQADTALRQLGVHNWSPRASTFEEQKKNPDGRISRNYRLELDGKGVAHFRWTPERDKFEISVIDYGDQDRDGFAVAYSGDVTTSNSAGGGSRLQVVPSERPLASLNNEEFLELRGNILGEWVDRETGEIYTISAGSESVGEAKPPPEFFDEKIVQIREQIKSIESAKIYVWKNSATGEIVKQEKFRRLDEAYEYVGQQLALDNAEEKIAALNGEIAQLEQERIDAAPKPVNQHDPGGFEALSASGNAQPITVSVLRTDGYRYTYDEALFDGRRIAAKRTYRDIRDISNLKLPMRVREQLVSGSWSPPGWLQLDTSFNAETGGLILDGGKWALKVTYSSFMGDPPDVSRIHTPWPSGRILERPGSGFEVAEGAAADFKP